MARSVVRLSYPRLPTQNISMRPVRVGVGGLSDSTRAWEGGDRSSEFGPVRSGPSPRPGRWIG